MKDIDWSNAPEGFDFHFRAKRLSGADEGAFYRATDTGRFVSERGSYISSVDMRDVTDLFIMTVRPQVVEWNGEGLPPVGTVCEMRRIDYVYVDWQRIEFLCAGSKKAFFRDGEGHEWSRPLGDLKFRPIRTPEQIAAEERDKAVAAMEADIARWGLTSDYNGMCQAMYDAGYRKQADQ